MSAAPTLKKFTSDAEILNFRQIKDNAKDELKKIYIQGFRTVRTLVNLRVGKLFCSHVIGSATTNFQTKHRLIDRKGE
jgi:hypothetical protein